MPLVPTECGGCTPITGHPRFCTQACVRSFLCFPPGDSEADGGTAADASATTAAQARADAPAPSEVPLSTTLLLGCADVSTTSLAARAVDAGATTREVTIRLDDGEDARLLVRT